MKLTILLALILLIAGCNKQVIVENEEEICEPCAILIDEVKEYKGILFNGEAGEYLYSTEPQSILPEGILLNKETNEMLEFFNNRNVLKIVPGGETEGFLYGGKYTIDETHLTMIFYANNEVIEEVEYIYRLREVQYEGYYLLKDLILMDSEGKEIEYIQVQKIEVYDLGGE